MFVSKLLEQHISEGNHAMEAHNTVYYTLYSVHFATTFVRNSNKYYHLYGIRTNVWDRYFLCSDGVVCSQRRIVCISLHCLHAEQPNTDPIDIAAADDIDVNNRRKSKRKPRRRGGVFLRSRVVSVFVCIC